jgi:spore germination cell wall hydrolase CwlJ-like protein
MTRNTDIDTLARTLWGEARGEGKAGMEAVAAVIMNRVNLDIGKDGKPDWWGEGVEGVCRKPWQFTCWSIGDANLHKIDRVTASDVQFAQALDIAKRAVAGELADPTGGATHYVTEAVLPRTSWARLENGMPRIPTAQIGRHVFFKLH